MVEAKCWTGRHTSSSVICSSCKEMQNNLPLAKAQKLCEFVGLLPTVSVPPVVKLALQLALQMMNDTPAMVAIIDHFSPMETFDLDNLVKVAEEYDKLCRVIKDRGEHEIAETCELVGGVVISSRDPHRSSADNLFAKLGTVSLNVHSKITIALISYLRHGQLFKIEKRFGFVEESYFTLDNDDRKQRGHDVLAKLPPSFRQIWNNQFIPDLGEAASKPDEESELRKTSNQGKKSKQGRESKPGKKPESNAVSEIEGLVKLQFNCKLAVKGLQDLSKTISNAKKPVDLPSLPTGFRYANVPVREDVPDEIRERILDQEFAMKEIPVLQGKVSTLLYQIHHVFAAWYGAGDAAWYVYFEAIPSLVVSKYEALKDS